MPGLRFRNEPTFENRTKRLRTYAFLFAFFAILGAKQAAERRQARAARAAVAARQVEDRAGLRLFAWRSEAGVEVAIVSSLSRAARVLVAVKELAGPWSPSRAVVEVPPGGLRLTLARALGERVFLLDPGSLPPHAVVDGEPLPEEREPRVLRSAGVRRGVGIEVGADGAFRWAPRHKRWLAFAAGGLTLEGSAAAAPRAPRDPVLDEALQAWAGRPDLMTRAVGPDAPLCGRAPVGAPTALPVRVSVRLDGGPPRAQPLQLLLLPPLARWEGDGGAVGPGP